MNPPSGQSLWYQDAIFYQIYIRAFFDSNGDGHGDLRGVMLKLDYIQDLGVDCIWLMPFYPSPLKDDGYDIADYYSIHPDYGTLDDFKALLDAAHSRGLRVITDLVLNHTSDQHPWFQAARQDPASPYREYYVWSDTDQKYADARIIFLDTEPSNWSWDSQASQYYWHRFYASQPDLNYDSPAVQAEMMNVMKFWLDLGVDGFRADAVPYLFEREGTNCENLPETHAYLKKLRRFMEQSYPGRILLCEANQWPEDVRAYFGSGDEFQMAFHFPIMPRIFMDLRKGVSDDMREILRRTPAIPAGCQWCIFLRNHDELTLEMVTEHERQWMWKNYAPELRMRLNLGIRRRLAPLLDNDRRKVELAHSLLFTLPGSPIIYYGDELGMGENIWMHDRNGVRTPMQWSNMMSAGFSPVAEAGLYSPVIRDAPYSPQQVNAVDERQDPASLLNTIRSLIAVRRQHPAFGRGIFRWLDLGNNHLAVFERRHEAGTILAVHNLSDEAQSIPGSSLPGSTFTDLRTGDRLSLDPEPLTLPPYAFLWLQA
jgi:maltose alpha-D-glucosyltransferase/alpha-amylase